MGVGAMDVYSLDPLEDARWAALVERHPRASIFHAPGWLRAIQRTYGFAPVAFTTCRPDAPLTNALVFCAVRSWLSGRRLVSLPFSDHCEPLVESPEEWQALSAAVLRRRPEGRWRYVELRPASETAAPGPDFGTAQTFYLHRLDLRPDLDRLLRSFHKDSIRRKIRRAERERLACEEGRGAALLEMLLHLLDLTRRRHQAPLQPLAWFRNLIDCLGERVTIRVALKDGEPAAGILTLAHRDRVVYKYGGSDARLNALGGMPFLFWRTIQDARRAGAVELDLGRSDLDNPGLIAFKEHLAATRTTLTYWRAPARARAAVGNGWTGRLARRVYARLPTGMRRAAGRLIYPHIA